jgi:hypothetical protein
MRKLAMIGACVAAALGFVGMTAVAQAKPKPQAIDLNTPAGSLQAMRKIQCSLVDGETQTYFWQGDVFSRKAGERDRLLFKVQGINVRQCGRIVDEKRGEGFRLVSREILLYLDPQTGQVLSKWQNPWTNETVDVLHVANDPVNNDMFATTRDGKPAIFSGKPIGDQWFMTTTVPLFYKNPLAGPFQDEVGGTYHATEMFNFMGDLADLTDPKKNTADAKVGWVRISDWLPWMKMGSREGVLYFHTAGRKVAKWEDLSQLMRDEVAKNYPEYRTAPPLDDKRPNETSWTYYLKVKEGKITPPKRN